jgi:hyperosmotically inducible periplasmic protein
MSSHPFRYSAPLTIPLLIAASIVAQTGSSTRPRVSARAEQRIIREVRHQILMLPEFGVFDNIAFKVNGYDVTLLGQVSHPTLRDDAARVIKKIEGVEQVNNRIEVLPPSFNDDRLRRALFRAIYGYAPLQHYGVGSNRPIHIIVNRGHASLEGVVDTENDKNIAGIRANEVPGVFSVENNLAVVGRRGRGK